MLQTEVGSIDSYGALSESLAYSDQEWQKRKGYPLAIFAPLREILELIEADRPLPDKYRFMLFDTRGRRYKIAGKVIDIFGNDTMKIVEVGV